jgi:shikimate dehydrogenase
LPSPEHTLLGLIGHPVSHSLSPSFHNAALRYCQMPGEYKLIDVDKTDLKPTVQALVAQGFKGFNITIPHKTAVFDFLDQAMPEARLVGAVNTVKVDEHGRLIGYNTDPLGFERAVERKFGKRFQGGSALLLGYGGSARAVLVALAQLGFTDIYVLGRDSVKLQAFIDQAKERMQTESEALGPNKAPQILPFHANNPAPKFDLITNTIPFGISTNDQIPPWIEEIASHLPDTCVVSDLVYRRDLSPPPLAKFMTDRGFQSQDGIEMLLLQALRSFEIWTGRQVPIEIMRSGLNQAEVK